LEAARELDPDAFIILFDLAKARFFARQYDEAIAELKQMLVRQPRFVSVHGLICASMTLKGDARKAVEDFEASRLLSAQRGVARGVPPFLGVAYARAGEEARARQVLKEIQDRAKSSYVPVTEPAMIYAALNEKELALAELERGFQERCNEMVSLMVEPLFDSLRDEPRFQKLVADMKFPE